MKNSIPFIYPDYIVHALNQLMIQSAEDKNGLLYKNTDVISVLYNQYNDFPVTEQVYSLIWQWIYRMVDAGNDNWIKQYWNIAHQYYMFKLEKKKDWAERERFCEFHVMACTLLFYKKRYIPLIHSLTFTNTLPPQYPLIPNTIDNIIHVYEILSNKNQTFYLEKYQMDEVIGGANEGDKVEGLLVDYFALLLIRSVYLKKYDALYSYPIELSETEADSIENINYKIRLIDNLKNHLVCLPNKAIKACLLKTKWKTDALMLLGQYKEKFTKKCEELKGNAPISEEKRKNIKNSLIQATLSFNLPMMANDNKNKNWNNADCEKHIFSQQIILDESLIIDGYENIDSNLTKIISNLHFQMQKFYRYQLLFSSAYKSQVIPYYDLEKVLKKLSLSSEYTLLLMGVSHSIFDEIEGFTFKDKKYFYENSRIYEMPSNIPYIFVMRNDNVPYCSYREIPQEELKGEKEIDANTHLYSNIDTLTKDNLTLSVKQCISVSVPKHLRYLRLQISYQLKSDDMLVSKIESINNIYDE